MRRILDQIADRLGYQRKNATLSNAIYDDGQELTRYVSREWRFGDDMGHTGNSSGPHLRFR